MDQASISLSTNNFAILHGRSFGSEAQRVLFSCVHKFPSSALHLQFKRNLVGVEDVRKDLAPLQKASHILCQSSESVLGYMDISAHRWRRGRRPGQEAAVPAATNPSFLSLLWILIGFESRSSLEPGGHKFNYGINHFLGGVVWRAAECDVDGSEGARSATRGSRMSCSYHWFDALSCLLH